jgi:hypothetical protein
MKQPCRSVQPGLLLLLTVATIRPFHTTRHDRPNEAIRGRSFLKLISKTASFRVRLGSLQFSPVMANAAAEANSEEIYRRARDGQVQR